MMQLIIEKLYAWIAEEENGQEGIIGALLKPGEWMPLVGADMARIESFRDFVTALAKKHNKKISLVEFSTKTILETIDSKEKTH